jgi:hypothetical protein
MGALCISAQARTAPRTTRKRHQRSVCVTAATPSRPQPIETSSNHLSGAGLGHASLPLAPLRASRRRPALRVAAGPAGNGGPGSWGDRKQRKDDQQIILGVGECSPSEEVPCEVYPRPPLPGCAQHHPALLQAWHSLCWWY